MPIQKSNKTREINPIEQKILKDSSLEDLVIEIEKNINILRLKLRQKAQRIIPKIPLPQEVVTGNLYVESVGSIVDFDDTGKFEFLYTPETLPMRDRGLDVTKEARTVIFDSIGKEFPQNSRILNIGAGGDITPIQSMENQGHEILSTDMAQNTIDVLRERVKSPVFACDLQYLDEVLPPESIDFMLGNSTLGYVDPAKLSKVIENLSSIIKHGAVFTFDLAPNPVYFKLQDENKKQTVVNESEVDPMKLLEFIKKYGAENGINAMAYYSFYRAKRTNIAVIHLIKELFEKEGLACNQSSMQFSSEGGSMQDKLILRVSKDFPQILDLSESEKKLEINLENEVLVSNLFYRLACVDRISGSKLAKELCIETNKRDNPWNVIEYIHEHLRPQNLHPNIIDEVLKDISPAVLIEKIRPYLYGEPIPNKEPLSRAVMLDQILHKMIIDQTANFDYEKAAFRVDAQYHLEAERKKRKEEKKVQKKQLEIKKKKRKQAKKNRRNK